MKLATIPRIEGYVAVETHGVVSGHVVIGANFMKDFMGKIRDFVGGRSSTFERVLSKGEQDAVGIMTERAREVGANGVVGVAFDYETMSFDGQMIMIMVTGTAVSLRKEGAPDNEAAPDVDADAGSTQGEASQPLEEGRSELTLRAELALDPVDEERQRDRYARDVNEEIRRGRSG